MVRVSHGSRMAVSHCHAGEAGSSVLKALPPHEPNPREQLVASGDIMVLRDILTIQDARDLLRNGAFNGEAGPVWGK